jgi:hypothetical protein
LICLSPCLVIFLVLHSFSLVFHFLLLSSLAISLGLLFILDSHLLSHFLALLFLFLLELLIIGQFLLPLLRGETLFFLFFSDHFSDLLLLSIMLFSLGLFFSS